jgi:HlyD family secretion protein
MKAGAISADDLEAAQTSVRTAEEAARAAEFTVTRSQSELEAARARLAPPSSSRAVVDVVAPVDGVVLKRLRESETVVPVGDPILEIGDPSKLEIVADFLSTDAVRIMPGAPVLIEQWGGGQALNGRVRRIEPAGFMKVSALGVEEQRVNVIADFVDPPIAVRALGDGYRVEVRVIVWHEDAVLKAPVGTLFRRGEGWAAFAVENGIARLRLVKLGQRNEVEGQILEGLSEGQALVLHPPDTLKDSSRVSARRQ